MEEYHCEYSFSPIVDTSIIASEPLDAISPRFDLLLKRLVCGCAGVSFLDR